MDRYERAAIIGYWRSGATVVEIAAVADFYFNQIEKIISEYQKLIDD